jgi:hypothetical protein
MRNGDRQNPMIQRTKLIFLVLFAVLCVALVIWQVGWVFPEKRCLEGGKWWDRSERVCAQPVLISDITGRTIQDKQAEAAAKQAIGKPVAPAK